MDGKKEFVRSVGEAIVINDTTTVTVLAIKGNQVKIGITSPLLVAREEVAILKPCDYSEDKTLD